MPETLFDVIIYPLLIAMTLIAFARFGLLINREDIDRYLGAMPKIKDFANKILFK